MDKNVNLFFKIIYFWDSDTFTSNIPQLTRYNNNNKTFVKIHLKQHLCTFSNFGNITLSRIQKYILLLVVGECKKYFFV